MIGKKTGIIARRGNIQSFLGLSYDRYEHNKIYCVLSGVILLVFFTMFAANTYAGGAKLFQAMTGQSYTTGLLIFTVIVLVTALMGGVKGVAGAIVFQGAIMTFAVLTFTVLGLRYGVQSAGSMENVYRSLIKTAPQYFDLSTSVSSWPVVVFFAISGGMLAYTMPQATMGTLVHKNTKSLHSAIKIGTIVVFIWIMGLTLLNPIVKYTFPDLGKYTDLGIPLLVIKTMPAWVAGLCLAGVSAAVQSSLNGMAVSLSSMVVNDIIFAFIPKASPEKMKKITLATTTAICILLLLLAWNPPAFLYEISIYSVSAIGVAFGMPVLLGYYWKRANAWGAIAAIVTGIPTYIYVFHLPGVPYNSGLVAGLVVSFIADVVVSLLTPKPMLGTIKRWFCASYYDKEGNLLQ
jgi:sodium/pantothenate symporter